MSKRALVLGAGGFIGSHLVRALRSEGYFVVGVDRRTPEFSESDASVFIEGDLRDLSFCEDIFTKFTFDEIYQLAAEMGGSGFLFTGAHDAEILQSSTRINLNVAECAHKFGNIKVFFSSSACIYPITNQLDPKNPVTSEESAYPAEPDSEYGWEKIFSERVYQAYARNHGLPIRIARYHNVYGPENAYVGGREKAPAAVCRKIAECPMGGEIEIWGDGEQTRSFLYIDDCLRATRLLMQSDYSKPINIGSTEMVSINELVKNVKEISGKAFSVRHIPGPTGVRGRTSDNRLIEKVLGWKPNVSLKNGMANLYHWVMMKTQSSGVTLDTQNIPLEGEQSCDLVPN